ncbi:MAG: YbaB/EbfC family nucleoid-associated protein [Chloroflexi bacterium]|nr:YbaB/EbfC family nucleoid-associated protein [Chloroflexota bacterium]
MDLSMVKQAMQIKSKMEKAQKELAKTIIEKASKDGSIIVTVNGQQKLLNIKISPEIVNPNDVKRLEKTLVMTIQDTMNESQSIANKQMKEITGGFNIPGLT